MNIYAYDGKKKEITTPVTYRFESTIDIIEMVDEYSLEELRQSILNSLNDAECPTKPFLILNLIKSTIIDQRSSAEVKAIAQFVASLRNRINNRVAMVASRDLPFGLMRMGSVGSEEKGITSEVFRSLEDAIQWILS